jgi:hypothetical protein
VIEEIMPAPQELLAVSTDDATDAADLPRSVPLAIANPDRRQPERREPVRVGSIIGAVDREENRCLALVIAVGPAPITLEPLWRTFATPEQ